MNSPLILDDFDENMDSLVRAHPDDVAEVMGAILKSMNKNSALTLTARLAALEMICDRLNSAVARRDAVTVQ